MNLAMSDAFPESTRVPIVETPIADVAAWAGSEAVYIAAYRDLLRVAFVCTGSRGRCAGRVRQDRHTHRHVGGARLVPASGRREPLPFVASPVRRGAAT